MWKLLCAVIVVAVLSTYADADRERGKHAIRNRRIHIQNLQPPIDYSVKGQEAIVIESEFLGYNYSTPKTETDGYVYTPGGYIYVTPTVKISTTTRKPTTKPSTPGTTYLPPGTTYLPPPTTTPTTTTTTSTTTPTTTTTTSTTTPTTTTTTSTTTPTTTTTTSTTTPSTTPFKPYNRTYLPPPGPPKVYLPPVRATVIPYPSVIYTRISTEKTITRVNTNPITISPPTLPPTTPSRPFGYYNEYLPPKEYLPAFITRK
ncbi:unnamed protein product [Lasius platythorax]|uniref:Uncharacterized protein n=1 Tax=Lasius platythorax TaxID=488582 RepID=A0AAV2NR63_9HYME